MSARVASRSEALMVSERLPLADQLWLIAELSLRVRQSLPGETQPDVDWLSLAGRGQELWRSVDVDAYIDQERDSWAR